MVLLINSDISYAGVITVFIVRMDFKIAIFHIRVFELTFSHFKITILE